MIDFLGVFWYNYIVLEYTILIMEEFTMKELLMALLKGALEKLENGEHDNKLVNINKQIRQVSLDVEKQIKADIKTAREQFASDSQEVQTIVNEVK